jgi:hypothetical protein
VGASYREDSTAYFNSRATLAQVGYQSGRGTAGGFGASVGFSLVSDPNQSEQATFPNQPALGLRLEYVFGNKQALRGPQPKLERK